MNLWFVSAAVLPEMLAEADIPTARQAALSSGVQGGFVCGALLSAWFGLADRVDPRRLFASSSRCLCRWPIPSCIPIRSVASGSSRMLRSSRLRSTLLGRNGQYSCIRRNARSSSANFQGPPELSGRLERGKLWWPCIARLTICDAHLMGEYYWRRFQSRLRTHCEASWDYSPERTDISSIASP